MRVVPAFLVYVIAAAALAQSPQLHNEESAQVAETSGTISRSQSQPTLRFVDKFMSDAVHSERSSTATIDTVMLHFCSVATTEIDDPFNIDKMIETFTSGPASAHYLIDRDGTVFRLVDEKRKAFHAGRGQLPFEPSRRNALNDYSIGIEMFAIGSENDMRIFFSPERYRMIQDKHLEFIGFTDAQYRALNLLLEDIRKRHPQVKHDRRHIVGHEEYAPSRRSDPGELFDWSRIGLNRSQ